MTDDARDVSMTEVLATSLRIFLRRLPFLVATALSPAALSTVFCCCGLVVGALVTAASGPASPRVSGQAWGEALALIGTLLFAVLSIVPLGLQIEDAHRVARTGSADRARRAPLSGATRYVGPYLTTALAYGALYAVGSALCLVPGVLVAAALGFAPVVAVVEGEHAGVALRRSLEVARVLGVRALLAPALHAGTQLGLLLVFSGLAYALGEGVDIIAVIAVELVMMLGGWVLFTYFAIVVPTVLYARVSSPDADAAALEAVFA